MGRRLFARAAGLCVVAGFVDAVGYTELGGVFAANMTGNTVLLAIAAVRGEGARTAVYGFTLAAFLVGALVAATLRRTTGKPTVGLGAAVALLAVAAVTPMNHTERLAVLALTMGLQGASISRFGANSLQTVVVTGTIVRLAEFCVDYVLPSQRAPEPGATPLHALAWVAYGAGAAVATATQHFTHWPLLVAALMLLAVTIEVTLDQPRERSA
ncbi:MAG TPA: YoaK family protein [Stellaceae bacterium]|nr:YoaK family protein [Stellaceae bacterium]